MKAIIIRRNSRLEKGQSLVLIALAMFVLMGMLALTLDGGMAYAQRRNAQNAADAATLAGVTKLCGPEPSQSTARSVALEYVDKNNAFVEDPYVDIYFPSERQIVVTTTITNTTFFAGIWGRDITTVSAVAGAGCYNAFAGKGMLPLAFPCPPYVEGSESPDCGIVFGEENMVILMESDSSDYACIEDGGLVDCDVDGDGIRDIYNTSSRGWLDLDGGGAGSSELQNSIRYGYDGPDIFPHLWLGGATGVDNATFGATKDRIDDVVLVPIFDLFCDKGIPETQCPDIYDFDWPDQTRPTSGLGKLYYRIIGVAFFKITCVYSIGSDSCEFRNWLVSEMGWPSNLSVKSIEGYFVQGTDPGSEPVEGGADVGLYVYRLSK
jgi:hypothetical protein